MEGLKSAAFQCVAIPAFPNKPRDRGITMALEYGVGLPSQKGHIETAGHFWDLVKLATGLTRILPADVLKKKIHLYRENVIHPFPGGQFFELSYLQGRAEAYLEETKAVGYSHVEISDNCIDLPAKKKAGYIRRAIDLGLTVLGETGKKGKASGPEILIEDLQNCREAGAWKGFVEAMELMTPQGLDMQLVEKLSMALGPEFIVFEIPSQWIKGITFHAQYEYWKLLIHHIGPDVNLANIQVEEILRLSLMRLGLGADPTLEKGAFVMTERGLLP